MKIGNKNIKIKVGSKTPKVKKGTIPVWTELFDVTFMIMEDVTPIENAKIVIDGEEKFTNALGVAVFRLVAGTFIYQITHQDYDMVTDAVVVTGNQSVVVYNSPLPPPS